MTAKITLDVNDIIDLDRLSDVLIENLSEDICKSNPDWWTEKVCKPMVKILSKLVEDKEVMSQTITSLLIDYVGYDYIKDRIDKVIDQKVNDCIQDKLQGFDITFTRKE